MMKFLTILFSILLVVVCYYAYLNITRRYAQVATQNVTKNQQSILQTGDIIFQVSKSAQSKAIQLATNSKYSHMGLIYKSNGTCYVYEAVQPVKLTDFSSWIKRGENAEYVVKRLKDNTILTEENIKKMKAYGERFKGRNYDLYFGWSDDRIYCSELVWKIYKGALGIEIGKLQALKEFDLGSDAVKRKLKERYGDDIPLNEKVISPAAMFNAENLITVDQLTPM